MGVRVGVFVGVFAGVEVEVGAAAVDQVWNRDSHMRAVSSSASAEGPHAATNPITTEVSNMCAIDLECISLYMFSLRT